MTRTAFDTKTAFDAFLPINDGEAPVFIFQHCNCMGWTILDAEAAADTGNAAVSHCCFAFGTVIAFNVDFSIRIAQIKNFLRALSNADTAAGTFSIIKDGQTVAAHRNCLERAALDAGAETKTAKVAFAWTTLSFGSQMTICDAFVLIGFGSIDLAAVTGKTTNFTQIFA